ncbi:hypothetical protein D3C79_351510 [compost metagenome]
MKKLSSDVLEQVSGAGLIRPLPFYFDKNKLPWGGGNLDPGFGGYPWGGNNTMVPPVGVIGPDILNSFKK